MTHKAMKALKNILTDMNKIPLTYESYIIKKELFIKWNAILVSLCKTRSRIKRSQVSSPTAPRMPKRCRQCGHNWQSIKRLPAQCPSCGSTRWFKKNTRGPSKSRKTVYVFVKRKQKRKMSVAHRKAISASLLTGRAARRTAVRRFYGT